MVGGRIINVWDEHDGTSTVEVRETDSGDRCLIRVRASAKVFTLDDCLWWQGPSVMWTPYDRSVVDHQFERAGYSYSGPYEGNGTHVLLVPEGQTAAQARPNSNLPPSVAP